MPPIKIASEQFQNNWSDMKQNADLKASFLYVGVYIKACYNTVGIS